MSGGNQDEISLLANTDQINTSPSEMSGDKQGLQFERPSKMCGDPGLMLDNAKKNKKKRKL